MTTALSPHEQRIVDEADAYNRRVIAERDPAICRCGGVYALVRRLRDDESQSDFLRCTRCGRGYVVTVTSSPEHIEVTRLPK